MNIQRRLTPVPQPCEAWHELKRRQLQERIDLICHAVKHGGSITKAAKVIKANRAIVDSFIYSHGLTVAKIKGNEE